MAEDIWQHGTKNVINDPRTKALAEECNRQFESCLYTTTMLLIWLRRQRFYQQVFIVIPIILGGVANWYILGEHPSELLLKWITATCAFIAGLVPAIYKALNLEVHLEKIARCATEYTNLRDRFRQLENISSLKSFEEFQADFDKTMSCMEKVRRVSLTPPEKYFKQAQKKIKAGDYSFAVDDKNSAPPIVSSGD